MSIYSNIAFNNSDEQYQTYKKIRDEIAKNIIAKKWAVGEALPTENELLNLYQVSVSTIIKALDLLTIQGLIERLYGKGIFVCQLRHTNTLFRFLPFTSLYCKQTIPEGFIISRHVYKAPPDIQTILRIPEGSLVIKLIKVCFIDGMPVSIEKIWLSYYRFAVLADLPLDEFGLVLYDLYNYKCNQSVTYTEDNISSDVATAKDVINLKVKMNDPILVLERIAYNYNQQPIEWRTSRAVANKVRYRTNKY